MSELLAMDYGIIEQLSRHKNLRFGGVSWPSEGHECPSYIAFFKELRVL